MTWDPIANPVDYIMLAQKRSPGVAEVVGASSIRKWDDSGNGMAWAVYQGRGLARFSVKLKLYTAQDWADWHAWKPIVDKLPKRFAGGNKKASGALEIGHPLLLGLGIKAVAVVEVMQPEQTGDGEWTIEIRFIEFRHPEVAYAKPDGAADTTVPDPVDDYISGLVDQADRLASEP